MYYYTDVEFLTPDGEIDIIEDVEFEVEYDYTPGFAPSFRGCPDNWSPGEPPEIDCQVFLDGRQVTDKELVALGGSIEDVNKKVERHVLRLDRY